MSGFGRKTVVERFGFFCNSSDCGLKARRGDQIGCEASRAICASLTEDSCLDTSFLDLLRK